jgi:hypothetical protein
MSLPEGYLPRKGDVVVLHATVKHVCDPGDDSVHLKVNGHWDTTIIELDKVAGLHRRHWDVGDKVQFRGRAPVDQRHGVVAGVEDDMVWVRFDDRKERFLTLHANQIEAQPEEPQTVAAEPEPFKPKPFQISPPTELENAALAAQTEKSDVEL